MIAAQGLPNWRSILFVPAHKEHFVQAAPRAGADAIQLDLEDSVPLAEKGAARRCLPTAIQTLVEQGQSVIVRVNRDMRHCMEDLSAAVQPGVAAICLPKTLGAEHLRLVEEIIEAYEIERGMPVGEIKIIAMVETAAALSNVDAWAGTAGARLAALAVGGEDLSAECGFDPTYTQLFEPCQKTILAARAHGLRAYGLPGSIAEFHDLSAFRDTVGAGKAMGFDGVFCIHPKQVNEINDAFQPQTEEIEKARRIVDAYDLAVKQCSGAVEVDGKMVDLPVVKRAQALLDQPGLSEKKSAMN